LEKQLALPIFPCFLIRSFGLVQKKYNFRQKTNKVWKKKNSMILLPKKMKAKKNRICVFRSYYSKKNKCIKNIEKIFFLSLICQNCDSNIIESYYMPTSMPLVVELVWADSAGWRFLPKKIDLTNFYPIYHFYFVMSL